MRIGIVLFVVALFLLSSDNLMAQGKRIVITPPPFDFDIRYVSSKTIPVAFQVVFINAVKDSTEHNYSISYKPKGNTKFKNTGTIKLNTPINIEALRQAFNNTFQATDDSVQAVSNGSIYEMAYILDTIPRPSDYRIISGNLILNKHIEVFDNVDQSEKGHKQRQIDVQIATDSVVSMNLKTDNLAQDILKDRSVLDLQNARIKELKYLLDDIENVQRISQAKIDGLKNRINDNKPSLFDRDTDLKSRVQLDLRDQLRKLKEYESKLPGLKNKLAGVSDTSKIFTLRFIDSLRVNNAAWNNVRNSFGFEKDADLILNGFGKSIDVVSGIVAGDSTSKVQNRIEREIIAENNRIQSGSALINKKILEIKEALGVLKDKKMKSTTDSLDLKKELDEETKKRSNLTANKIKTELSESEDIVLKTRGILGKNDSVQHVLNTKIVLLYRQLEQKKILKISKVSIQIERGFIERIQVYIPGPGGQVDDIYENIYAIGFSSVKNFKQFTKTKLHARLSDDFIYLSDVIANYDNFLENYTRDYCPADTSINHFKPSQGFVTLKRDLFTNLFDARVYTDLLGIKDDKPNGLIQIELSRRFNIKTSRYQWGNSRFDWGTFTYLNAFGSLNKIEENKKYLPLRNEDVGLNGQLTSPFYATNLDFRRYQNFSLGTEMNIFLIDWPDGKLTGYFDLGLTYGQTPLLFKSKQVNGDVVTTADRDSSLVGHSSTVYPKFTVDIFSEKRIGFSLSYQFNSTRVYSNNDYKAIMSYAKSDLLERNTEPYARRSHMIECNITASPTGTKSGRFFFRARYFMQHKDRNTFFSQIQFGYTYNFRLKKFEL